MDLKQTLNLPDSEFTIPMKADLPAREPKIQKRWREMNVYKTICDARRGRPKFILHDGPPYTNNVVHIGTALNKSLKDFVVKYKTIRGFFSPYVPGYDNHGLPIEMAVQERIGKTASPAEMRDACRQHAENYIKIQTAQFERLGVFGEWDHPYKTMDYRYEACIVRAFAALAKQGYVYRDLKPTHWSTFSKTALADTELVYEQHTSHAIYVRFPLRADPNNVFHGRQNVFAIIWTTTPWTIPANLALAFHPDLEYALIESDSGSYLVVEGLAAEIIQQLQLKNARQAAVIKGQALEGAVFKHPIFDRDSIAVLADYVTTEEGTGIVHTAPGHGADDFYTGRKYGLPVLCPVDEAGFFTSEAGEFAGLSIVEGGEKVVEKLRALGHLMHDYAYEHQYPYSERDHHPVIFRATEQWFFRIDHNDLRAKAQREIHNVKWFPAASVQRISAMVESRPDWCLSRQRVWGVGIPIIYGRQSGIPVLDQDLMERVAQLTEQKGSGAWFEVDLNEILPEGFRHPETNETEFRKETDVLDVWFDSGITHLAVLKDRYDPHWSDLDWPADLYLEGSDQHRGWFNSSLITATAIMGAAPYRQVLTNGWTVDEHGRKMSKSLGNVIDPVAAAEKFGADIIRLWAGSVDYSGNVHVGENLLKQIGDMYRRIRNTLRFLLANLYDFDASDPSPVIMDLDQWAVDQVQMLEHKACEQYDEYDFSAATALIHNFCVRELSAFYLDAIKDRMYCDAKNSPERRSGQRACREILTALTKLIAPILVHTAEELYERLPIEPKLSTVFLEEINPVSPERFHELSNSKNTARYGQLLAFRERLYAALEAWKTESQVKDTQDIVAKVSASAELTAVLEGFGSELPTLLKLSHVELDAGDGESYLFTHSSFLKCDRCRLRRADVELRGDHPLCGRCAKIVLGDEWRG